MYKMGEIKHRQTTITIKIAPFSRDDVLTELVVCLEQEHMIIAAKDNMFFLRHFMLL